MEAETLSNPLVEEKVGRLVVASDDNLAKVQAEALIDKVVEGRAEAIVHPLDYMLAEKEA